MRTLALSILTIIGVSSSFVFAKTINCQTDKDYKKNGFPRTFQVQYNEDTKRADLVGMPELYKSVDQISKVPFEGSIDLSKIGDGIEKFKFSSDLTLIVNKPAIGEISHFIVMAQKVDNKLQGSLTIMNFYAPIFCDLK